MIDTMFAFSEILRILSILSIFRSLRLCVSAVTFLHNRIRISRVSEAVTQEIEP